MSPETWKKLEALFEKAVDLPVGERSAFLDAECGDDTELRQKAEELLRAEASADSFIEQPVWGDTGVMTTRAKEKLSRSFDDGFEAIDRDVLIGTNIGHFELKEELGRGGMGAVYLAERTDGEFRQRVAVKLIRRGMDSDFVIKRFRHERQILASFEHPFIARLIDGGTREDGTPYFIMEYVEGKTLFDHCDATKQNIVDRLNLFAKICSAVEYAHQKKIVHRDIKPSNILVNKGGEPKLLDFGIAKVLDPDLIHDSVNPTASMLRLMTPDYASPEQIRGDEVTHSSDIYSLGVLLYELLSGHRPFNLSGKALHEITYAICEEEPLPPSRSIGLPGRLLHRYSESTPSFSAVRSTTADDLASSLSGNLDNIVMKALGKTPGERYGSVAAMLDDIANHLAGRSVNAEQFDHRTSRSTSFIPRDRPHTRSLAVLPFSFINLGSDEDTGDKFLGIGIADAVVMRLSKIRRLVVRPTSSVLPFGSDTNDPQKAGDELRVEFILTGNLKKTTDRLRISVQLLNVKENAAVWATSIDEDLSDVFTLEDKLSTKVAEALLPQLTGRELADLAKRGTNIPEAYEHYIRGKYHFNSFTEEGLARSFVCFHSAIAADPGYALAYTGLADYYSWLGIMGVLPPQDCFQPAIKAATTAVELDDELSDAHATLGFALHAGKYDRAGSEKHLRRALILNPGNGKASVWFSIVLFTQGRFEEGLQFAREGLELDPLTPFSHHNVGWGLYYARRFEESADHYRRMLVNFPEYPLAYFGLSKVLRASGHTEEAVRLSETTRSIMGDSVFSRFSHAESLAANGEIEKAAKELAQIEALGTERYVSPYFRALVRSHLSRQDKENSAAHIEAALDALEEAVIHGDAWLNWLLVEPAFDQLKEMDRFWELVERTGISLAPGQKKDVSPTGDPEHVPDTDIFNRETLLAPVNDDPVTADSGAQRSTFWRKVSFAVGASVVCLSIAAVLIYQLQLVPIRFTAAFTSIKPEFAYQRPSLMVAPFKASGNTGVGIGFADALGQRLGVVNGIEVISSNTARIISAEDPLEGASEIGVKFLMTGELSERDGKLFLDAVLIDVPTKRNVLKTQFAAAGTDYFDLQKQAGQKVLETIGIRPQPLELKQIEKVYTNDLGAYEKYLIGRSQLAKRNASGLRNAITSFSEAIEADGEFALAFVGLADAYSLLNLYDIEPPVDAYKNARRYAERALAIDNELAEAHASMGYIQFFGERNRAAAELEFRRAVQMNPSYAQAHHWFGLALAAMGKSLEAHTEIQMAERLDPRSLSIKSARSMILFFDRQYEQALVQADRALSLEPQFVPAHKVKRWVYSAMGRFDAGRATLERERLNSGGGLEDPGWHIIEAQVVEPSSDIGREIQKLDRAIASADVAGNDFTYAFEIALAFNHLGQTDRAIDWLERAEKAGTHGFNLVEVDPRLDNLRSEPRFQRLLEKLRPQV